MDQAVTDAVPAAASRRYASDTGGWIIAALLVLALYAPIFEYGPQVLQRFLDLDFAHYQLSETELGDAGSLRYLRDGILLAGSVIGLMIPGIDRRGFLIFVAWESLVLAIGTTGHLTLARLDVYASGLRWLLNLHFAATVVVVLSRCSPRFWRRFRIVFGFCGWAMLVLMLAGLVFQWIVLDLPVGVRLTSLLPQAQMVDEIAQGLAIYFSVTSESWLVQLLAFSQLVAAGFFTATRMAPLLAGLLWARLPAEWLIRSAGGRRALPGPIVTILALATFAVAAASFLPLASLIAQRGPVLEQQIESARLAGWPGEIHIMEQQSLQTLLLGKGLGYRTTTAGILRLMDKYHDPYLEGHDNGIVAIFAQTGAFGLIVVLAGVTALFVRLLRAGEGDRHEQLKLAALAVSLVVLSVSGYWYEWPLFVQPIAVTVAWFLRDKA